LLVSPQQQLTITGMRARTLTSFIPPPLTAGVKPQPEPEVHLRAFVEADRPKLDEWARRIDSTQYMSRYMPKAGDAAIATDQERPASWYVIVADGAEVGTVWLEQDRKPDTVVLGILLGDASLFGHGIGRNAIHLAIEEASRSGSFRVVRLNVRADNGRAIGCYERCGFHAVGSGTREAGGKSFRYLSMEKELGSGEGST
jgi:RimJ/RimL family protein N-acetyltransferase